MTPDIAIVIPASNAAGTLAGALEALRISEFDGKAETIVVDDASTDDTSRIAKSHGARLVATEAQRGPAGARNAGVEASTAPLIAFTDADCQPSPKWVQAVADGLRTADLVMGPVLPDSSVTMGRFDRTLRITEPSPWFETANLGVRRTVFDAVGGFEPFAPGADNERGFRPRPEQGHIGEDVVFGCARRLGARVASRQDAVVFHAVFRRGPRGYIAEKWRLRYFPALVKEVPELRRALPLRLFLSRRTCASMPPSWAPRRRYTASALWPLLPCVDYAHRCLRTTALWRRSAARENLALVTGDAVALIALVRGSVAARRLLL